MEENNKPQYFSPVPPVTLNKPEAFPTGKGEFIFGALILLLGWLLVNSVWFGGFNLGAAIGLWGIIAVSTGVTSSPSTPASFWVLIW